MILKDLRKDADLQLGYRFHPATLPDLVRDNAFHCALNPADELVLDWEHDVDLHSFALGRLLHERTHMVPVPCPVDVNPSNFK